MQAIICSLALHCKVKVFELPNYLKAQASADLPANLHRFDGKPTRRDQAARSIAHRPFDKALATNFDAKSVLDRNKLAIG